MSKIFSIYRSSAGSGKTRTLAKEYLLLALQYHSDYFKHILAVTFTNKATQEMKDRVLGYLDDFAKGRPNELGNELKVLLKVDDATFQERSVAVQSGILHQYSKFSISTIDAFFQQVIRSFTREAGLMGDYRLEVEEDIVLEEIVDNLIDELGTDSSLTEWVIEFAKDNLENERAWDIRYNLIEFAKEIFRENFKLIEETVNAFTSDRAFFKEHRNELWKIRQTFLHQVAQHAGDIIRIMDQNGWDVSDLNYGRGSGLVKFLPGNATAKNVKDLVLPSPRIKGFTVAEDWPGKKSPHAARIVEEARKSLAPIMTDLIELLENGFEKALSAEAVLRHMYVFGLLSDISRKLKEFKDENNIMLLSDAPKFLNGVIQDSDTPFIYEKVGSFYRNYLIDEFQDTSILQWKNFLPLLTNGLDQGYSSLVVGDVKQAIYRWRGGDLNLLQDQVEQHIGPDRVDVKELDRNFRSSHQVIRFNNLLFEEASKWVTLQTGQGLAISAFKDVSQQVVKKEDGFVQVSFIQNEESEERWYEKALAQIPVWMEDLQNAGVPLRDIAILVRMNSEGQRIANFLLEYRNSENAKEDCRYDVISNESLRLDGAASVNLLLAALRYLLNPLDSIARAQLSFEYARVAGNKDSMEEIFNVSNQVFFEEHLPDKFAKQKAALKKLPLVELIETLVEIFSLHTVLGEFTYLQAFQDVVMDFSIRERNDLGAFLDWWELNKHKKSIQVSGEVNAARIITIHKSKGLQFKYVLIPFCSWSVDHDLRNAPNLWVTADKEPFHKMGFFPVKYSPSLQNTYFKEQYEDELTRSYLDNLNLLYVALTRAELGLIVMAPHPSAVRKKTVATILYDCIVHQKDLSEDFKSDLEYKVGDLSQQYKEEEVRPSMELKKYLSSSWRNKMVIRQSAKSFFSDVKYLLQEKTTYGIHLHTILSRITFVDSKDEVLQEMIHEGLITHAEKNTLQEQLDVLLGDELVLSWFLPGYEIRTEVPILLPDGTENRIDRLMIKDKTAIVVDFKTGEEYATDQLQVQHYMKLLRQMNFIQVEGYLLYTTSGSVVSVKADKPRVKKLKNKDEKQLGLGF